MLSVACVRACVRALVAGAGHVLRLERTFRSPQELSAIAGDFVMKNPGQLRKQVRSEMSVPVLLDLEIVGSDPEVTAAISKRLEGISALLAPGTSVAEERRPARGS